ncbi:MAG TPA: DNA topoisomerase IB [Noviherbaspirillum sp.]|uniref:DNA topoisomerase IB n=1 Tax=Noviherbaspirillum sp. TaxID=1926288 RepID=UPI002D65C281|nr:DNA topoisomerase IB [Noviherbaspirillum sp.]HYD94142.1 DNA topoisomerase IB [Noviherbaspirillum sp.]
MKKATDSTAATAAAANGEDLVATAKQVGLRYVGDGVAGITRVADKDGFRYLAPDGKTVRDEETLARIKALAIPPAWTEVWICPWSNGHIQATGRDAKRRKQYRYHARWRSVRDEAKYERMLNFGRALPVIRKRVNDALKLPGLPREKVLATIVYLLEATMMRIGNEEYARHNKSFGLTTLRDRHVRIDGSEVEFRFRGKSGVQHSIRVGDPRLARIIRRTRDLPGQELFQYVDDAGEQRTVGSADVNDYLREITGEDYTAKDFRTWSGTVLAALALQEYEKFDSEAQAKKNVVRAIESVAEKLGNTPSICRKCYVHPAVIESYLDGTMLEAMRERARDELAHELHALDPEEAAVVALLQERLARAVTREKAPRKRGARAAG